MFMSNQLSGQDYNYTKRRVENSILIARGTFNSAYQFTNLRLLVRIQIVECQTEAYALHVIKDRALKLHPLSFGQPESQIHLLPLRDPTFSLHKAAQYANACDSSAARRIRGRAKLTGDSYSNAGVRPFFWSHYRE